MPPTVAVKTSDTVIGIQRQEAAQRVIAHFGDSLPDLRLLCFFDDEDWLALRGYGMAANRGGYFSDPFWRNMPHYIRDRALVDGHIAFDELIYLHGSTCSGEVSLTMTFAHELQHFVQHSTMPSLWAANTVASTTLRGLAMSEFQALGLRTCEIPIEREARIVAKRVAVDLLGTDSVNEHIESKIAERITAQDAADWDCIRGLAVHAPYDLADETKHFFPRLAGHRSELERALGSLQTHDVAFRSVDLDSLLSGTG